MFDVARLIQKSIVVFSIVMWGGCRAAHVELPVDSLQEAVAIAKADAGVQEFVKGLEGFRVKFEAQFLSQKKVWLVRVFPQGDINDVEMHVLINSEGDIVSAYSPPL